MSSVLNSIFSERYFSEEERAEIISAFTDVRFRKGDFLLEYGKVATDYWFVESGFLRSFAVDPHGNDITTGFFSRSEVAIDWPSFLGQTPTGESMEAITDTVCWQLDFEGFQELFHGITAFREAGRGRLVKSHLALKQRSVSLITDRAKDRYLKLITEKPDIFQNVPLKQIASYLGVTDTSLSRIRKEVARD